MRFLAFLLAVVLCPIAVTAADNTERVSQTANLDFYSAFWPNLHHTLYAAAWARRPHTNARPLAGPLPEPLDGALTADERAAWEAAIAYYDHQLADRDLLFDQEMTTVKERLSSAQGSLPETGLPPGLHDVLLKAASVYRKYWWPAHDRANRAWIADVVPRVSMLAPEVTARLARLMLTPWFTRLVRVDVVWVGNVQGAYTSIGPDVHITVASGEPNDQQWAGAETIFHESSHALIAPVQERIDAAIKTAGKTNEKHARVLWHVVLFWTVGEVVREALDERHTKYEPYLYSTGLFQRAWPELEKPVETEWAPYVNGKISLDQAVDQLVKAM